MTCWKSPPRAEHSLSKLSMFSIFNFVLLFSRSNNNNNNNTTINFNSSFSLCRKFGHFALEKTVFFVVVQQQWGWLDQFRHFFISPFLFQRFVDTFQLQSNKGGFDMVKTSPIIFFLSFNYSLFYSNIVENTDSTSPI